MKTGFIFLLLVLMNSSGLRANNLETFFELTKNRDYNTAKLLVLNIEESETKSMLFSLLQLLTKNTINDIQINLSPNDPFETQFLKNLILGYRSKYARKQDNLQAFKYFSNALKLSEKNKNIFLSKAAIIALLDLFSAEIFIGSKQYTPYLERFIELKSDAIDETLIIMYKLVFFSKADENVDSFNKEYYNYYRKLETIFQKLPESHNLYPYYYFEKGIYYKIEDDFKNSEKFFLKADSLASKLEYLKNFRGSIAWQLAYINMKKNKFSKAKDYLNLAQINSKKLREVFYNDRLNSLLFEKENKFDSAYYFLKKSVDIEYQLGYKNNTLESSILTVQNQTDKLKLDKLELDAKSRKNRNWAIGLGLILLFGTVTAFQLHSTTKRKQKLAEQLKTLHEQKIATLLKDQELTVIDAMIKGQEKERQRIANDLHDDLGSLMANVKLHFNSLQGKNNANSSELFFKTNTLLDEAYDKIRAIAHAKNSGVIAKQGLLRAIQQMAEKVSTANKIKIDVKDFGLNNRLENSLELGLFRIVQELISNIIKHAKATKVNIHLTNHGDSLNIMVEDNGIGFNSHNSKTKGMGLKSIDKRISYLEGTFHIESAAKKGTSVIIDIPL